MAIMCRSNFDKQSGDYNLYILEIAAFKHQKRSSVLYGLYAWLRDWFRAVFSSRRQGRGHVRL